MSESIPAELFVLLRTARHVVVLTGAGVSAESGIPTFRNKMMGLWERYEAEELARADAFRRDRALVWGWYEWRRKLVMLAQPNPAHLAIAALAERTPRLTVITQNVDDLHERAGSRGVIHLHGEIQRPRCFACNRPFAFGPGIPDEPEGGRRLEPPRCAHCNGYIRPGVVWFGEMLPQDAWKAAAKACEACDLMFVVGTSALVHPAASLPEIAARRGVPTVQVNPNATALDDVMRFNLTGAAGEIMPRLL
ncbi:MAG: NAD-dependent deacylase [Rhodocyclaceae bacterium]|nr:NAD-dependent deacylase [Rhodocyclaceae bacterium]